MIKKSRALKHKDYLSLLSGNKNKKQRNNLINLGTKDQINAVTECVTNILNGNIAVSNSQLKQLRQHKNAMRKLTLKSISATSKKKILKTQSGGFLLASILPAAIAAISSLFTRR